jgi:hypothetical protein
MASMPSEMSPSISPLEEVVVFFLNQLPFDECEEIMLFFNGLDDETKEMYLQDCMKINATGTPVEVGSQIFNMTQISWLVGSCDTTIEMVEEKKEHRLELTELTPKEKASKLEAVEDFAMKPMDI